MYEVKNRSSLIFGAIVFLLCLSAVYGMIELALYGPFYDINLLLLFGETFNVNVVQYLCISMLLAAVSFGAFFSHVVTKLMVYFATKPFEIFDDKLRFNRRKIEKNMEEKFAKMSMDNFVVSENLNSIKTHLETEQETVKGIVGDEIKKITLQLDKEHRNRTKHLLALGKVEKKIENIEFQLMPKASLISMSEIDKVSGVGEKTANEFKSVGIMKVEDLLIEDSKSIAQKTKISDNKIENIQLTAQLLMIPGTNGKTVRLLQKAGIDAIEKLAKEDTLRLFRKIAKVTEENEYRPTLEEIASYIKYARTNYAF